MKTIIIIRNLVALLTVMLSSFMSAQETVVFNINQLAKGSIESGAASLNTCWLLDSDIKRPRNTSNEARFAEMGVGSLRYPYGHLADNYLWDTPPFGGTLEPKVATLSQAPGSWSWATNSDKTMNKIMDFDEFMEICQRQNIKPLIVVNALSYKYNNGPTYQDLKTTAVEWVKYAKNKGYDVAYWQIANEIDHHQNLMTQSEYVALYQDFVAAMKVEDPTIICGPGILSDSGYLTDLLNKAPTLVNFTSVHQYLFSDPFVDYPQWRDHNGSSLNSNVSKFQNAVNSSSKPNLPILITESNAYGNWDTWPALYKVLAWFDMLYTQHQYEDVAYTYMWNSHSPWNGENDLGNSITNALFNDIDNGVAPMGLPLKIMNSTAEERYMIPDNKVHGNTYSYGSYSPGTGNMTLYFINKSTAAVSMTVNVANYNMSTNYEKWVLTGNNQYDSNPTFNQTGTIAYTNDGFTTDLPPYSLVVVKLKSELVMSNIFYLNHLDTNRRLITNVDNTDAITTADAGATTTNARWNFIDTGDGYVYIECIANNMRLNATSVDLQNESSVNLVDSSNEGDTVKWQLTQVADNYFIDNKGLDRRLNLNNNKAAFGLTSYTSSWQQWRLTSSTLSIFNNELPRIQVYPNPVKSELTVKYGFTANSEVILTLYNIHGQVIKVFKKEMVQNKNQEIFDFTNVTSGLYFANIKVIPFNGNTPNEEVMKIIVQK